MAFVTPSFCLPGSLDLPGSPHPATPHPTHLSSAVGRFPIHTSLADPCSLRTPSPPSGCTPQQHRPNLLRTTQPTSGPTPCKSPTHAS